MVTREENELKKKTNRAAAVTAAAVDGKDAQRNRQGNGDKVMPKSSSNHSKNSANGSSPPGILVEWWDYEQL